MSESYVNPAMYAVTSGIVRFGNLLDPQHYSLYYRAVIVAALSTTSHMRKLLCLLACPRNNYQDP